MSALDFGMKRVIESIFAPEARLPSWWKALISLLLIGLAVCFWLAASSHGEHINRDLSLNDQKVYMNLGSSMKDTNYEFFIPRTRMPLYMAYVSLFYETGTPVENFFPIAKRANIALCLVCVSLLAIGLRFWLGWGLGVVAALLSAFTWFVEKAGYVQPEALLATLIGFTCAMLAELMRKPTWWKAVIAGVLLAGWHMTKASGPVILGIFFIAWSIKMILPGGTRRKSLLVSAAVLLVSFTLPVLPYLAATAKMFGSPFYNTQSKYFFWCTSAADKHAVQVLEIDYRPPTAADVAVLPSAKKYFEKHTLKDVEKRIKKGTLIVLRGAHTQHPELFFALSLGGCLLLGSAALRPRKAWALVKDRPAEFAFVAGVITAFVLLFGWMQPLHIGPRMITSIHLVPLFFSLLWTRELIRGEVWSVSGMTLSVEKVLIGCVLMPTLLILGYSVLFIQMPAFYFGQ
jgi:hypothetical protein